MSLSVRFGYNSHFSLIETDNIVLDSFKYVGVPAYRALLFCETFFQVNQMIDMCCDLSQSIGGARLSSGKCCIFPSGALIEFSISCSKKKHKGKKFHFLGFNCMEKFYDEKISVFTDLLENEYDNLPLTIAYNRDPIPMSKSINKRCEIA